MPKPKKKDGWIVELRHQAFRVTSDGLLKSDNGEYAPYRQHTYDQSTVAEAMADGERVFSSGFVILPTAQNRYVMDEDNG